MTDERAAEVADWVDYAVRNCAMTPFHEGDDVAWERGDDGSLTVSVKFQKDMWEIDHDQ